MMADDLHPDDISDARAAWYVVQVKRCRETRVVRHLALKAVPTFLPFVEVNGARRGQRRPHLEPLFPGYLFVQMAQRSRDPACWQTVRWSPGVRSILGCGEVPVPVPDEVMAELQSRVAELGFIRPGPRFSGGTRVRIRNGPLAGLEAVFDRPMSRAGRVRVLLELLGQQRAVEVDEVDLESA
jgi:transcriptional antiterminator RfaH